MTFKSLHFGGRAQRSQSKRLVVRVLKGSCHCGAITVTVARKPRQLTECNCSICRRYGALWAYYSRASVKIIAASKAMDIYSWGDKILEFHRCARCGCITHYERAKRGPDSTVAINARMLEPEVIGLLRIRRFDGASTWKCVD